MFFLTFYNFKFIKFYTILEVTTENCSDSESDNDNDSSSDEYFPVVNQSEVDSDDEDDPIENGNDKIVFLLDLNVILKKKKNCF